MANNIRCCLMGGNKAFWSKNTQKDIRVRLDGDLWIKSALYGCTTRQRFMDIEVQQ